MAVSESQLKKMMSKVSPLPNGRPRGLRLPYLSGAALPAFASINKSRIVPGAATAVRPAPLAVPSGPAVALSCGLDPVAAQIRPRRSLPGPAKPGTVGEIDSLK